MNHVGVLRAEEGSVSHLASAWRNPPLFSRCSAFKQVVIVLCVAWQDQMCHAHHCIVWERRRVLTMDNNYSPYMHYLFMLYYSQILETITSLFSLIIRIDVSDCLWSCKCSCHVWLHLLYIMNLCLSGYFFYMDLSFCYRWRFFFSFSFSSLFLYQFW